MKILLSYNIDTFDPNKKLSEQKNQNSSGTILACCLYTQLSKFGEVTYTDSKHLNEVKGQYFDVVVAIANGLKKVLKSVKYGKFVFFGVNMFPKARNQILKSFVKQNKLDKSCFCKDDIVKTYLGKYIKKADEIWCVGNEKIKQSFVDFGIPAEKVFMLNYGLNQKTDINLTARSGMKKFVYVATTLALRKGFDLVVDAFERLYAQRQDFQLVLVGNLGNQFYLNKFKSFMQKMNGCAVYYGFVNSSSSKYEEIISDCDYLVFPSLEEGQAGTVLDCISRGLVPLLSENTGVSFSPLGYFELSLGAEQNLDILNKALDVNNDELCFLKRQTIDYYQKEHADFYLQFEQVFKRFYK